MCADRPSGAKRAARLRCDCGIERSRWLPLGCLERKKVEKMADGMGPFFWEGTHFSRFMRQFQ